MISKRLLSFLSNRTTAIISLSLLTVLTLYLSKLDSKLSQDSGVFALQTAFSAKDFTSIIGSWGPGVFELFPLYLKIDIIFAVCYAIAIPSIMLLMFTQLKKMADATGNLISPSFDKMNSIAIVLPAAAAFCNILSDILLFKIIHSSLVHSYLITMSASFQIVKISFLGISLVYLFILLMKRRRLYRKLR